MLSPKAPNAAPRAQDRAALGRFGRAHVAEPVEVGVALAERAHSISPKFAAKGEMARVKSAFS
ncbi:MAG: hypothetical protein IPL62_04705 [Caulobacteraceae bacterium]|nr:hypothetical protein [Caulobacteraceae bacterium]